MSLIEDKYIRQLTMKIKFLLSYKSDDFNIIVQELGSVDILVARDIYNKLIKDREQINKFRSEFYTQLLNARSQTSQFVYELPSPNSMLSQWWFSLNTIEKIAFQIKCISGDCAVAFFGAPSVAFFYSKCFNVDLIAFDIDEDIVKSLTKNGINSQKTDILTEQLPIEHHKKYISVFMDPPWYDDAIIQFTNQAAMITQNDGYIFASIPSQLTRPGIVDSRQNYIKYIQESNLQLLSIDSDYFDYSIPTFENVVLDTINAEINRAWRKSDLLVVQSTENATPKFKHLQNDKILSFYTVNSAKHFRVFIKQNEACEEQGAWFSLVKEFSKDISTRRNMHEKVHMWTSNQVGYSIKNYDLALRILTMWQAGESLEKVAECLEGSYSGIKDELVEVNKNAFLWTENNLVGRRTPKMIAESANYSPLAVISSERRHAQKGDGFRLEFQRDRDRIIWSESFRKLANKCQVFSFDNDEINTVRTRLTHSIEVMQLASTIGNSFGLNMDLIEAGALCHDIGHAPFGHGGEFALNNILNDINKHLGGFNHYEHGLDVVEFIENPYSSIALGGFNGLNLMPETLECIAKHTFSKTGSELSQDAVYTKSKYQKLIDNKYGSLESQTVRIADKISYMLSDIEDGAKMGAIRYEDVIKCRLFNKAPVDLNSLDLDNTPNSFYNLFVSQRRAILKIIMEDVLTTSEKRLSQMKNNEEVKNADGYLIRFSSDLQDCMDEIWTKLQSGLLHKDSRVEAANFRAAQITSALFYLYAFSPELIDSTFKQNHKLLENSHYMQSYNSKLERMIGIAKHKVAHFNFNLLIGKEIETEGDNYKIPTYNVILAKDYVASLSDQCALKEYHAHFGFTK
jgi:dGTPase